MDDIDGYPTVDVENIGMGNRLAGNLVFVHFKALNLLTIPHFRTTECG